ncbi:hypothetical protein IV203_038065 [Nitzschia inconspicua]|uniref:Uncharacterized protein n=1 Tax=Nitzschia inconspicua TaxID=303405 RepID=A0A9K3LMR2_9STRA|nr:hypothetical protein IV203_038065 [Nitzschia inconspicua]
MTAGTVTRDGLEAMINGYLENSALYQLVLTLKNSPTPGIQQEETLTRDAAVTTTPLWGSHIWGGRLHHVPQDFAFPNSCSQIAWQYWMCGDRQKWYPPLRNLSRDDMPSTNMRNRLSDLRNLMQLVEKRAEEQRKWIANPSIEQANEMFEVGKDVLDISDVSEKGRKRRGLQMKWTSMVTRVRNKRTTKYVYLVLFIKKYLYNTKLSQSQVNQCFWSDRDFQQRRRDDQQLILDIEIGSSSGSSSIEDFYFRGLESCTHVGRSRQRKLREESLYAVLEEHWYQKVEGWCNAEAIANLYQEFSLLALEEAQWLAKQDAQFVLEEACREEEESVCQQHEQRRMTHKRPFRYPSGSIVSQKPVFPMMPSPSSPSITNIQKKQRTNLQTLVKKMLLKRGDFQ